MPNGSKQAAGLLSILYNEAEILSMQLLGGSAILHYRTRVALLTRCQRTPGSVAYVTDICSAQVLVRPIRNLVGDILSGNTELKATWANARVAGPPPPPTSRHRDDGRPLQHLSLLNHQFWRRTAMLGSTNGPKPQAHQHLGHADKVTIFIEMPDSAAVPSPPTQSGVTSRCRRRFLILYNAGKTGTLINMDLAGTGRSQRAINAFLVQGLCSSSSHGMLVRHIRPPF